MNAHQELMETCHELTEFCLARAGRCMAGWSREKIFIHIYGNAIAKQLFTVKVDGKVSAIAIIQPTDTDNALVGDIIGDRSTIGIIVKRAFERFPRTKKIFTYRREKLVELPMPVIQRFIGGVA